VSLHGAGAVRPVGGGSWQESIDYHLNICLLY
jgi:hypothetical protein